MPKTYSDKDKETGLVALAMCSGSTQKAAKVLAEEKLPIAESTLRSWRRKHSAQYEELREMHSPRIKEQQAEHHARIAERLSEITEDLAERMAQTAKDLPPRDLPGAVRNASTAAGIHSDKAGKLREDPTQVVIHDWTRAIETLRRKGLLVEGEAEEEPPQALPAGATRDDSGR